MSDSKENDDVGQQEEEQIAVPAEAEAEAENENENSVIEHAETETEAATAPDSKLDSLIQHEETETEAPTAPDNDNNTTNPDSDSILLKPDTDTETPKTEDKQTQEDDTTTVSAKTEVPPPHDEPGSSDWKPLPGNAGDEEENKDKGLNEKVVAQPTDNGNPTSKHSFLLEDDPMSQGNESGTEEDQSNFMKELEIFFRERAMEFKPPKFYGEGLNCLK